jgi:hypothetical protein
VTFLPLRTSHNASSHPTNPAPIITTSSPGVTLPTNISAAVKTLLLSPRSNIFGFDPVAIITASAPLLFIISAVASELYFISTFNCGILV